MIDVRVNPKHHQSSVVRPCGKGALTRLDGHAGGCAHTPFTRFFSPSVFDAVAPPPSIRLSTLFHTRTEFSLNSRATRARRDARARTRTGRRRARTTPPRACACRGRAARGTAPRWWRRTRTSRWPPRTPGCARSPRRARSRRARACWRCSTASPRGAVAVLVRPRAYGWGASPQRVGVACGGLGLRTRGLGSGWALTLRRKTRVTD